MSCALSALLGWYHIGSVRTQTEIESAFSPTPEMGHCEDFYLVGMGGVGMSGVAQLLRDQGHFAQGCDAVASDEVIRLQNMGFAVAINPASAEFSQNTGVIVTDAVNLETDPIVLQAKDQGLKIFRRSQALGWLLRRHKVIAVTGTHGKTTTTGMLGKAMRDVGKDPVIVVGAHVPDLNGSVVCGKGIYAVVEACEAYDALRDLNPAHVVLTNLEPDHMDFHGSWETLQLAILRFLERLPADGRLFYCAQDRGAVEIASRFMGNKTPYAESEDQLLADMALPGEHNRLNAQAVRQVALGLGIGNVDQSLMEFTGAERRMQIALDTPELTVVDDYAHHPAEIEATIQGLREKFPNRRLVVVFQPHLYSRTADFLDGFALSLSRADHVVLTDIYPAREAPLPGMSSARIAEKLTNISDYVPSRHLLPRVVSELREPGDVIVGMGAGNISSFVPDFLIEIDRPTKPAVMVCYGGDSAEREVSLHSGTAIHAALLRSGYDSRLVDISDLLLSGQNLDFLSGTDRPGIAFLAVHGTHAEDGAIQGFLEMLHIPYTGSGIKASAIAMDKEATKQVLKSAGLPVAGGVLLKQGEGVEKCGGFAGKVIVKPNSQGSTVGLSFVEDIRDLPKAIEKAMRYAPDVLVEDWIEGIEISIPVLGDQVLPIVEIVPATGKYDFESKYTPGATDEICPARFDEVTTRKLQDIAIKAHKSLGCSGATRTDMIVQANGDPVILEVNTLPGMTPTSLLPRSAGVAGISFDDLCVRIIKNATQKIAR